MAVSHFEFHVEEVSMEAFLLAWLPRFLPQSCTFGIYPYRGKDALLRKLPDRLRGYATWIPDEYRIVIVVDRDGDDCHTLKGQLEDICNRARLRSRRANGGPGWQVVTRIAIEELEAWYFAAYPRVPPNNPSQARYQNPDAITGGTWEAFERILQRRGYFKQGLAKVQSAKKIGEQIDPQRSRSHSFSVFRDAISEAIP